MFWCSPNGILALYCTSNWGCTLQQPFSAVHCFLLLQLSAKCHLWSVNIAINNDYSQSLFSSISRHCLSTVKPVSNHHIQCYLKHLKNNTSQRLRVSDHSYCKSTNLNIVHNYKAGLQSVEGFLPTIIFSGDEAPSLQPGNTIFAFFLVHAFGIFATMFDLLPRLNRTNMLHLAFIWQWSFQQLGT